MKPALLTLELHVTYRCNMRCPNCSNLISQAPSSESLSPERVATMLLDCVIAGHRWNQITIHGGEPALAPGIRSICRALLNYKSMHNPSVVLWLLTNDTPQVREIVADIEEMGIGLGRAPKEELPPYVPVNESPTDLGERWRDGCFQAWQCGIAYNSRGYYPCSPMAAAARVFDYPPACTSAADISDGLMLEHMKKHCKHCGFSMPGRRRSVAPIVTETWAKALEEYRCRSAR